MTTTSGVRVAEDDGHLLEIWIRDRREELGLTLEGLAASSGVSRNYLSLVEGGLSQPSVQTVSRIAEALGVTLDELATVATSPATGTHRLVGLLVDAGMELRDAMAIQSRLTRPLRDALYQLMTRSDSRCRP